MIKDSTPVDRKKLNPNKVLLIKWRANVNTITIKSFLQFDLCNTLISFERLSTASTVKSQMPHSVKLTVKLIQRLMFALSVSVLNVACWFSYFTSGVHTDYLCGAILWWLWDERPPHQLWEELQPSPLHVHYAFHKEWAAPRGTQRAIQAENHPNHHACLPLHQDTDQRHSEGGGNDNPEKPPRLLHLQW